MLTDPTRQLWKVLHDGTKVYIVDGKEVKRDYDVDFVEGGHWLVYSYIPRGEIWIDKSVLPDERPYVLAHEMHEVNLMKKGIGYEAAHGQASAYEKNLRQRGALVGDTL
ncbi:MAG: hypothetical protein LAO04_21630 [Acidobacteriia bacterium]|nr:hypothetical protein [Terriglobia bacterium]